MTTNTAVKSSNALGELIGQTVLVPELLERPLIKSGTSNLSAVASKVATGTETYRKLEPRLREELEHYGEKIELASIEGRTDKAAKYATKLEKRSRRLARIDEIQSTGGHARGHRAMNALRTMFH